MVGGQGRSAGEPLAVGRLQGQRGAHVAVLHAGRGPAACRGRAAGGGALTCRGCRPAAAPPARRTPPPCHTAHRVPGSPGQRCWAGTARQEGGRGAQAGRCWAPTAQPVAPRQTGSSPRRPVRVGSAAGARAVGCCNQTAQLPRLPPPSGPQPAGRTWLPMCSRSLKPRVTTSAVRSPLRSSSALVATYEGPERSTGGGQVESCARAAGALLRRRAAAQQLAPAAGATHQGNTMLPTCADPSPPLCPCGWRRCARCPAGRPAGAAPLSPTPARA